MQIKKLGPHCLVCGFNIGDEITDGAWQTTCPCCGNQIGYSYTTNDRPQDIESVKFCRNLWSKLNYKWQEGSSPKGWNEEMALNQIKNNVPEEFL